MSVATRIERPPRSQAARGPAAIDFDLLFAFLATATTLFILLLPSIGPGAFFLLPLLYAWRRPERLGPLIAPTALLLLVPALGLLSILWSDAPGRSAYYGTEFLVTVVVAIMLGGGIAERATLLGLFAAFALYVAISVSGGQYASWSGKGGIAFVGIAGSKNSSGDVAALGSMVALAVAALAVGERRLLLLATALVLLPIELWIVRQAESTGAVVALACGSMCVLAWSLSRLVSMQARAAIFVVTLAATAVAVATRGFWLNPLFATFLKVSGKDSTLTGRTYIWRRADLMISQKPLLGHGFATFWRPGNLEAEAIWRAFGISNKSGFNFHNSFREITVQLGYAGFALIAAIVAVYGATLLIRTMREPDQTGILFGGILVYELARMPFESIGLGQFQHSAILLFAGLAWGAGRRWRPAGPAAAMQSPGFRRPLRTV